MEFPEKIHKIREFLSWVNEKHSQNFDALALLSSLDLSLKRLVFIHIIFFINARTQHYDIFPSRLNASAFGIFGTRQSQSQNHVHFESNELSLSWTILF